MTASPEMSPPVSPVRPETPSPVPGAGSLPGGTAPGRGRATSPAGAAPDADDTAPAGSTTWTVELPPGLPLLSLNGREHWAVRARYTRTLKKAAWATALQAKIPRLERVSVVAEYQPPDRRHRDSDNPAASVKACIDGIVQAGVLPDDESPRYVESVTYRIGEPYPKGRLVLYLTEVSS